MTPRTDELAGALQLVRERVAAGCRGAQRDPGHVHLIVVTKTYPASDVRILARLGVDEVGESRDQEAAAKAAQTQDLALDWHFVGRLQSNKARSVARYAAAVHSLDRASLVAPLGAGAADAGRIVRCFVQVTLDGAPGRGGATAAEVPRLADLIAQRDGLRLAGVMAVAPLGADPDPAFAELAEISDRLRADHPGADGISAGMSGDLEHALRHGATHLRVGRAVLGQRPSFG